MRYWLYKDARIVGPLDPAEITRIEGAGPDLLLCPEGRDGSRESDWKLAGEIPELSSFFPRQAPDAVALLDVPEAQNWPISEFSPEELIGLPYFQFWEPRAPQRIRQEEPLGQTQRVKELEAKLAEFEKKISQYERQQGDILDRLSEKEKLLGDREKEIQRLELQLEQARSPLPSAEPAAIFQPAPAPSPIAVSSKDTVMPELPPIKPSLAPVMPLLYTHETVEKPKIQEIVEKPTIQEPVEKPKIQEVIEKAKVEEIDKPKILEIPAAVALPATTRRQITSAKPFTPPAPTAAPSPLPAAVPDVQGPIKQSVVTPSPAEMRLEPPSTGLAALVASPTAAQQPAAPAYTPSPMSALPADPFGLPNTMIRTPIVPEIAPDMPEPLASASGLEELTKMPPLGPAAPPKAEDPSIGPRAVSSTAPKRGHGKKLILFAALALIGMVAGSLFLMKESNVGSQANDSTLEPSSAGNSSFTRPQAPATPGPANLPGRAAASQDIPPPTAAAPLPASGVSNLPAAGMASSNGPAANPVSTNSTQSNMAAPTHGAGPSALPQTPGGAVSQGPSQSPQTGSDHSEEAINLVKNFSLSGGRGTISAWMQRSYLPGDVNASKWTANSVDSKDVYMVQYQVPDDKRPEPNIYVFQVDVNLKSVKGFNVAAKELLSGSSGANGQVIAGKHPKRKARKHRALRAGEVPLLPLPSDTELSHTPGDGNH